jgi:hypothetical protein
MNVRCFAAWGWLLTTCLAAHLTAAPLVPGTGQLLPQVGDNFEDPNWGFVHNFPKSSEEIDKQKRFPTGRSTNGRWYEGIKRGQPDFMRVVPTPEDGLPGSQYSLLMRTVHSGIPGRLTYRMQQDDLVVNCEGPLRTSISVAQSPSAVVRVYMPPFEQWEDRSGPTLGIRLALQTHAWKLPDEDEESPSLFRSRTKRYMTEVYWPGFFVQFQSKSDGRTTEDAAYLTIRGNTRGADVRGPEITTTGWWTFGMSCTPDGQVHFYASPGVDDLTSADYILSQYPYGYRAEHFRTLFFNICNRDDGSTWSTPWIIDDPSIYVGTSHLASQPAARR